VHRTGFGLIACLLPLASQAQADSASNAAATIGFGLASATVQVLRVRPDIYMLTVGGVNVTVETGPQGTVVVDTGPAASSEAVLETIRQIASTPINYVIDTNADGDLIGGNIRVAPAGESLITSSKAAGATVIAREALVAEVLSQQDGSTAILPNETFSRPQYNFYLNEQGIAVMWQPAAHSDVDLAVRFWRSDVVATGAVFDMTRFPVIDVAHGGSIAGEIDAINRLLNTQVIAPIPIVTNTGGTVVIPVRGPLADQADLVTYRDMLQDIRHRVEHLMAQHRSLDQIESSDPAAGYAARFGADTGDWTTHRFIAAVYQSLMAEKRAHRKEPLCSK
jgi:glyoxylase-like metal-dependent hydrolase (beta-lactamase superfamily II)